MYVVQVRPQSELKAMVRLRRKGFKALVPQENRLERRQGEWVQRLRILFAGYVFIDLSNMRQEEYYSIKNLDYVLRFLGADQPAQLDEKEAEFIRFLAPSDFESVGILEAETLEIGSRYKINGYELKAIAINQRQRRATFEMNLAGEEHRVTLSCYLKGKKTRKKQG